MKKEVTRLQQATIDLNNAIDNFWNNPRGLSLTGMGDVFCKEISTAQQKCKEALKEEQHQYYEIDTAW